MSIPLESIKELANCQTSIKAGSTSDAEAASVSTIFLKPSLFTELFGNNTNTNVEQKRPDLSRYGYLSHIRRVDKEAFYSIVLSHRVGPFSETGPVPVIVHLVSLEGIEDLTLPLAAETQYVAIASLHSWSYTCMPPQSFDVESALRHLGETSTWLRATAPAPVSDPDNQHVIDRMNDGYTLTKYRVQTGETTAAKFRGALTPKYIPHPSSTIWNILSDSGMDLQILDEKLGLVDITYYSAWQLGKKMAIADRAFSTALTKLRATIHVLAMAQAKVNINREGVAASTSRVVGTPAKVQDDAILGNRTGDLVYRWISNKQEPVDLTLGNKALEDKYARNAQKAAQELAQSADGDEETIYNELNKPRNTDWAQVLTWILDKMFLSDIPSQYLVVDPNHLPLESLRFFHIDANWIDAFIDGALSVGSHVESRFDKVRASIKRLLNRYVTTPLPTGHLPPVPSFGFLMRSEIVSRFPDLRVTAEFDTPRIDPTLPSTLRQVVLSDGVLLCLLDVSPFSTGSSHLTGLKFTQPPHQQSFAIGQRLTLNELSTSYGRIYTTYDDANRGQPLCEPNLEVLRRNASTDATDPPVFRWGPNNSARTLQFPAWSDRLLELLQDSMPKDEGITCAGTTVNSAIVGIQLTMPINESHILTNPSLQPVQLPGSSEPRTFWVPDIPDWTDEPEKTDDNGGEEVPLLPIVAPLDPPDSQSRLTELAPATGPSPDQVCAMMHTPEMAKFVAALTGTPDLGPTTGPSDNPSYTLQISSNGSGAVEHDRSVCTVPMGERQDLVFSVTLANPDLEGEFFIDEIHVIIPMGAPSGEGKHACLMQQYDGPGPSMLSNLRFNVLASVEENGANMLFRLVPRTSGTGGVHFKLASEISFLLHRADINTFAEPERTALVTLVERYKLNETVCVHEFTKVHRVTMIR
ncbi:hypothetical protein PSPO01_08814 [Paraphaeosphaeria sporulosa]